MADKYLIALEINEVQEGAVLEKLPLHSTVMHWFEVGRPADTIVDVVHAVADEQPPVLMVSGDADLFGPSGDVPVNRIRNAEPVASLHRKLFAKLSDTDVQHEAPQWTLEGFNPHVSVVNGERFNTGDRHLATHIYAVVADADNSQKKHVITRAELKGE